MKWFVGFLVLANLALLMWGLWYYKPLVVTDTPSPRPAVAPDKMKLLSEPGVRLAVRTRSVPAQTDEVAVASSCYQLGSFRTLERARAAGTKLETWGLAYERIAELETLGPAYRVVTTPFPSKAAAERKRRELAALGFTDNALIQQEEGMENAISFGIFSVEQNARARVQQLTQKGVRAIMQPVPNVHPIYWLRLAAASVDGRLADVPLERFATEDWGSPDVALRSTACQADADSGR
jgi:hypothetical protein